MIYEKIRPGQSATKSSVLLAGPTILVLLMIRPFFANLTPDDQVGNNVEHSSNVALNNRTIVKAVEFREMN